MSNHQRSVKQPRDTRKQPFHEEDKFDNQTDFAAIHHTIMNSSSAALKPNAVLQLQSMIGNRAVQRLLRPITTVRPAAVPSGSIQLGRTATYNGFAVQIHHGADAPDDSVDVSDIHAMKFSEATDGDKIKLLTGFINKALKLGNPAIVNCAAGAERSPTVAGVHLMMKGATAAEALAALATAKHIHGTTDNKISIDFVAPWLVLLENYKTKLPSRGRLGEATYNAFTTAMTKVP